MQRIQVRLSQCPFLLGHICSTSYALDLRLTIIVPLQRFNQANLLKRTIFELIAEELLQTLMPESRDPSSHGSMPAVGGATIGYPLPHVLAHNSGETRCKACAAEVQQ